MLAQHDPRPVRADGDVEHFASRDARLAWRAADLVASARKLGGDLASEASPLRPLRVGYEVGAAGQQPHDADGALCVVQLPDPLLQAGGDVLGAAEAVVALQDEPAPLVPKRHVQPALGQRCPLAQLPRRRKRRVPPRKGGGAAGIDAVHEPLARRAEADLVDVVVLGAHLLELGCEGGGDAALAPRASLPVRRAVRLLQEQQEVRARPPEEQLDHRARTRPLTAERRRRWRAVLLSARLGACEERIAVSSVVGSLVVSPEVEDHGRRKRGSTTSG
mmetsp:Transcript_34840/g.113730  ORF Transcript_34840/g.113730 Transcript_34840/m.113730 type:complete len:276 (+) Transcript_34840:1306-2133(+)